MIRILHRFDLQRKTRIMEERLDGIGPWFLVAEGKESPEAGYVTGDTGETFDFDRTIHDCSQLDSNRLHRLDFFFFVR